MSYTANMTDPVTGLHYFPYPYSVVPLPYDLRSGLAAVGTLALMSVLSTLTLLLFLSYRFLTWRVHYNTFIGYNQYVMLVMSLLLADLQQSAGFMISFHWIQVDHIIAPTNACFAQGWLIHSGDVASGFFVLAIALHTWYSTVCGRRLSNVAFYASMAGIWALAYLLTAVGAIWHREKYFVRAGTWCWVSAAYESERLAFHYMWIFIVEIGTILIYIIIWFALRQKMRGLLPASHPATISKVSKVTQLMMYYPIVYVTLTLPLAAGRMWSMSHQGESLSGTFQALAGSLITSCGWVDSLLYTLTRKSLLNSSMPGPSSGRAAAQDADYDRSMGSGGITLTTTVTIEGGKLDSRTDASSDPERHENELAELDAGINCNTADPSTNFYYQPTPVDVPPNTSPMETPDLRIGENAWSHVGTKAETTVEISAGEVEPDSDEEGYTAHGRPQKSPTT